MKDLQPKLASLVLCHHQAIYGHLQPNKQNVQGTSAVRCQLSTVPTNRAAMLEVLKP